MEDLRRVFEGRDVVLAAGVLQGKRGFITWLRALGARRIVVIASMGTGPAPEADEIVLLPTAGGDPVGEFRHWERIAADPPAHVRAVLDRHPDALVLFAGFEAMTSFGGRPAFGARPPAWTAMEDKTTVDALWDDIGVARPPSLVVPVADAWRAHEVFDDCDGSVWAGDASQGFNGGGIFVHWVRTAKDAARAVEHLRPRCDRVRVAPFVEGIPCSIHAFVTADGVAVLRPVELLTLRASRPPWFNMCGCATSWDPSPADRDEMRGAARRVGAALRDRVDYRGFFTIDGILSADGWVPTELNPRTGGGLVQLSRGAVHLPVPLLHLAAIEGVVEVDAARLEATLVPLADDHRHLSAHCVVSTCTRTEDEVWERDGITMTLGPGAAGAFLQIKADDDVVTLGESFAPLVARAIGWADEHWKLGIGPLSAARSVR